MKELVAQAKAKAPAAPSTEDMPAPAPLSSTVLQERRETAMEEEQCVVMSLIPSTAADLYTAAAAAQEK